MPSSKFGTKAKITHKKHFASTKTRFDAIKNRFGWAG